jgi:hypothetical protein
MFGLWVLTMVAIGSVAVLQIVHVGQVEARIIKVCKVLEWEDKE